MSAWAIIETTTGQLVSVTEADDTPTVKAGHSALLLEQKPDYDFVMWDVGQRAFVERVGIALVDRVQDIVATDVYPALREAIEAATDEKRQAIIDDLIVLLGSSRWRNHNEEMRLP